MRDPIWRLLKTSLTLLLLGPKTSSVSSSFLSEYALTTVFSVFLESRPAYLSTSTSPWHSFYNCVLAVLFPRCASCFAVFLFKTLTALYPVGQLFVWCPRVDLKILESALSCLFLVVVGVQVLSEKSHARLLQRPLGRIPLNALNPNYLSSPPHLEQLHSCDCPLQIASAGTLLDEKDRHACFLFIWCFSAVFE